MTANMPRYEIRAALPSDEEQLMVLAGHLNTVNLPHDRDAVRALLDLSERSFSGEIADVRRRKYIFILTDREASVAVGTSMILAQLGSRDAPYIYFTVFSEEKYSHTLDRHFHHTCLRLGFSYDGPTEIGGLVVRPDYRRVPERLGLLISYVRFLFLAIHPERFQNYVLAELLPPLEADGTSHLWEALGRHFTGMSYIEADRLSSQNKDFIRDLFPSGIIYASVLSDEAQRVIGEVGAQTKGVEKMLRRVGFRYVNRVDPFDGGPHFAARSEEIELIQRTRKAAVRVDSAREPVAHHSLVAKSCEQAPYFRAVATDATIAEVGAGATVSLSPEVAEQLGVSAGDEVACLSLH